MIQKFITQLTTVQKHLQVIGADFSRNYAETSQELGASIAIFDTAKALSVIIEHISNFPDKSGLTGVESIAPLQDTIAPAKVAHTPATEPAEPIAVQAETAPTAAPAPAPKATPPASKSAEQTAPKPEGWIEKPKTDGKLNSASQENYADKSDAGLDQERRLLCRDAVLKGAQPEAVRNFTIEKFGVRTVGAIPREKHGEWVRTFKETFGV